MKMFKTHSQPSNNSRPTRNIDGKDNQIEERSSKPIPLRVEEQARTTREIRTREKMLPRNSNGRREYERDEVVLVRRQKQIDFGKNTLAYDRYQSTVPKDKRTNQDPKTPLKHLKMNRRTWDGLVKNWKLKLHKWDAENPVGAQRQS